MSSRLAEQDDWRRKYYDSLKAVELEGHSNRVQLESLYKLVSRLCVAAQGQSPRLDEELNRLRDAVRRMVPFEQLEPMGKAIAEVVLQLDAEQVARMARQARQAESPPATSAASLSSSDATAAPSIAAESHALEPSTRAALAMLLQELAREPHLADAAQAIESELGSAMPDERKLHLIEKVAALVMQRIGDLERSRRDLEQLLGQMLEQLDSLTRYIAGQGQDETDRTTSTLALNAQITGEVRAIGDSVAGEADLIRIRDQLRSRLDAIGQHLHLFRVREAERARQARERTESLRERMDQMESEARRLQAKLSSEKRLSLLDPLTRIANRLAWDQRYAAECDRWRRFRQPTCVLAWDIDHFKTINDSYGHRAGDKVLAVVAESLARSIRGTDFVARYGGEEFVMLLPGTRLEDGVRLANRMRETVAQIGFHFRGKPVSVTVSCGITQLRDGDDDDTAFDRADKAMYRAKEGGRNRVVSA